MTDEVDDSASGDSLDLSPRNLATLPVDVVVSSPESACGGRGRARICAAATLSASALFFYNADEAVERRDELVEQRFRMQGTPFGEPFSTEIDREGRKEVAVVFPISFDGIVVDVVHTGSPARTISAGSPGRARRSLGSGAANGRRLGRSGSQRWLALCKHRHGGQTRQRISHLEQRPN